jgi:23S rRNA (guanosine2251-2'-O)-methyltransferase
MSRGHFQKNKTEKTGKSPSGPLYPKGWRAVIGNHSIREALQTHPKAIECLWLKQGWESSADLKKLQADFRGIIPKVEVKPPAILDRLATTHQGAALFLNYTPKLDWQLLKEKAEAKILLVDGIEDPHNLGAILRTAWLTNVDGVLIPQDRAVGLTPIVHKVASGGVEHVPVEVCHNFSQTLEELKKLDFWVYGLSHTGKNTIFDLKLPAKVVWCVGAEDKGLRITTERLCDELVHIPQANAAASYNASVAVGMALTETLRQHSLKKP